MTEAWQRAVFTAQAPAPKEAVPRQRQAARTGGLPIEDLYEEDPFGDVQLVLDGKGRVAPTEATFEQLGVCLPRVALLRWFLEGQQKEHLSHNQNQGR